MPTGKVQYSPPHLKHMVRALNMYIQIFNHILHHSDQDIVNGKGYACVGTESIWEIFVPSS